MKSDIPEDIYTLLEIVEMNKKGVDIIDSFLNII